MLCAALLFAVNDPREKCFNFDAFALLCASSFSNNFITLVDINAACTWKLYSSIASHSKYALN